MNLLLDRNHNTFYKSDIFLVVSLNKKKSLIKTHRVKTSDLI